MNADLITRCRQGDRTAQQEIYIQTCERIYRVIWRITRNPDDAFDLSQETYIRAFSRIEQFDGKSSFATWLYRIAVNESLRFLRHQEHSKNHIQNLSDQSVISQNLCLDKRVDVQNALAVLDPNDRAILLLRYQEGLDYRHIAEVIDAAEGTVASRLNRARDRLREILRESYDFREENDAAAYPNSSH